jgi:hypothetical protein
MSLIYSHISGKYIDTDSMEAVELINGDVVAMDDDASLLEAYDKGMLTKDQMLDLGFTTEVIDDEQA